jgi:hypothetical protein
MRIQILEVFAFHELALVAAEATRGIRLANDE